MIELHLDDCLEILSAMPEMSVDAIVTDPPYGLSFMGKKWDYDVPDEVVWRECLRVLKPGGHLLCFAGTRTQHRMAVRIERELEYIEIAKARIHAAIPTDNATVYEQLSLC